uniref:Elongator complex protein 6 n=1 Tax=Caenorhabditis japonica TaxID=281687 RepID=A0A8R1I2P9_CAEJA
MLKILKGQEDLFKGIIVCDVSGNTSPLPFLLHFLATATSANEKVAIVTSRSSELSYRLICSKAGVRWAHAQVEFIELLPPFKSLRVCAKELMHDGLLKIQKSGATAVLFDDLSLLEHFGADPIEVTLFVHQLYSDLKKSSESVLVYAPFCSSASTKLLLRRRCNVYIQLVPVGHGFGKEATAKALLSIKSAGGCTQKKGILLSGERAINGTWMATV